MMGGQVALLGGLAARLYQVQVVEGGRYATLAEENRISARLIAPPRGRMLDRFGTVVAGNRLNWRALLIAEQTNDVTATLDNFARIVPLADYERARIEREVHRHRRFIPIMVREFLTWDEMAAIEVNAPDLPGILVDVGTTRIYPVRRAARPYRGLRRAAHRGGRGRRSRCWRCPASASGAPAWRSRTTSTCAARAGAVQLEVNAVGRVIRELDRQEGMPGEEVGLTIDAGLQQSVLRRLGDESASAVVLDCRNGEVLAMGTNPSFDPSLFNSGVSQAQWARWTRDKRTPLINRAIAGRVCAWLDLQDGGGDGRAGGAHRSRPAIRFDCPGYLDLGNARFHCWRKGGHGSLDLRGGIKNSCDVYFYETARRIGIDRIAAMSNRLGLGTELRDRPARRAYRPHPDPRMAHRPGPSVEPRRHRSSPASARATSRSRRCSLPSTPRASPPGARWSRT